MLAKWKRESLSGWPSVVCLGVISYDCGITWNDFWVHLEIVRSVLVPENLRGFCMILFKLDWEWKHFQLW